MKTDTTQPAWKEVLSDLQHVYANGAAALEGAAKGIAHNSEVFREMNEAITNLRKFSRWCLKEYMAKDPDVGDQALECGLIKEAPCVFSPHINYAEFGDPCEGDEWYEATKTLGGGS